MARVGLVAGETSGDLLGGHLITALKARVTTIQFEGIAGPRMVEAGCCALGSSDRLAVNGYVEVLSHLPGLLALRRKLTRHFVHSRPDVFVGIDAPDFNFGLEQKLKQAGIPTVHFVSPSLWAWRGERIHKIKRAVSRMLVVFPFEADIYAKADIPVSYVGHPLADVLPLEPDQAGARRDLGLPLAGRLVALLPGSRVGEVKRLLPALLETARMLVSARPDLRFVLPVAGKAVWAPIHSLVGPSGLPISLTNGLSTQAMTAADVVVLASGTATLEAALLKKPMVITYRVPGLSYAIMRRQAYLPWVGLPNILLRRFAVPELLQDQATPEALARATLAWLDEPQRVTLLKQDFLALHQTLRCNAAERIAEALLPYLQNKS
ncbi:MAG TPA: lipid-A-disaccharide synthase [Thiobacillaceae bacterium]|nr:lipid-A-disaccharide synthase [Thiobacillaceae bacterium]